MGAFIKDTELFSDEIELLVAEDIRVYVGGMNDRIRAYDQTGNLEWSHYLGNNNTNLTHIYANDKFVYASGGYSTSYSNLVCLDLDGNLIWELGTESITSALEVDDSTDQVYVGIIIGHTTTKVNASGSIVWSRSWGSSDRTLGILYDKSRGIVYSCTNANIRMLDDSTGNTIREETMNHGYNGYITVGLIGDNLYTFTPKNGIMRRFDANTILFQDSTTFLTGGYIDNKLGIFVNFVTNTRTIDIYSMDTLALTRTIDVPYDIINAYVDNSGRYSIVHSGGITYFDVNDNELWTNSVETSLKVSMSTTW